MSGGSYNYLCHAEPDTILNKREDLQSMAERLNELGSPVTAAVDTYSVLLLITQFEAQVKDMIDKLEPVWRAVEWCDSGDMGKDDMEKAILEYSRSRKLPIEEKGE